MNPPVEDSTGRAPSGRQGLPARPPCPFCEGRDTGLVSPFGSHASVSTYWCRPCGSPFEILKWRAAEEGGSTPDGS